MSSWKQDREAQRFGWCVGCKQTYSWKGYPVLHSARCPDCGTDLVRPHKTGTPRTVVERTPTNASRYLQ